MDTKRLFMMMLLVFAVMFGWRILVEQLYQRNPDWKRPGDVAATQPVSPTTAASVATQSSASPTSMTAAQGAPTTLAALRVVSPATTQKVVTLGADAAYRMRVQLN